MRLRIAAVVAATMTACGAAFAQATTATTATTASPASTLGGMLQGLVGLAIVVALIFAAAWAMRKIGPRGRSSGAVQVVGGASVGPRERVVVVRFGTRTLLLGVAPGQVSLLHAGEPGDALDEPSDATAPAPRFVDRLRAARGRA